MGKVETVRYLPAASRPRAGGEGEAEGWDAWSPELLDLLAEGDPPAFATDARERIVFWNRGATAVLGRRSEDALGRHCYEVVCGRDVFGNRLCSPSCPILTMARAQEPIAGFEARLPSGGDEPSLVHITVLRMPGPRPDLFTLVHVLQPIDPAARAARGAASTPAKVLERRPPAAVPPLTPRETEILHLVAAGLHNKEIASTLGLSLATVRNHVHNTLTKLEVHSKLEMISMAFRNGWVRSGGSA